MANNKHRQNTMRWIKIGGIVVNQSTPIQSHIDSYHKELAGSKGQHTLTLLSMDEDFSEEEAWSLALDKAPGPGGFPIHI